MTESITLPGHIARQASERPNRKALAEIGPDGEWVSTTWGEYWDAVRNLAKGLIALGVQPGDGVALVGNNRRDWVISQMGISAAGAIPAPIYVTNTVEQVAYIVKHCRAKIAICDNQDQLDKYLAGLDRGLIELDHIITMDPIDNVRPMVTSLADVITRGSAEPDDELERRMDPKARWSRTTGFTRWGPPSSTRIRSSRSSTLFATSATCPFVTSPSRFSPTL
jgi:long-subunit acyl-CoA synthetase (AMP-forming)